MKENSQNTILYVDDDTVNLELFEATYMEDYNILLATGAKKALDVLLNRNDVKLVITDQRMPEITGIEFIEIAYQKYPEIVFMILSAYSDFEIARQAITGGVIDRFILKPWKKFELKIEINKAIEKHELRSKNKDLLIKLEKQNKELIELKEKLKDEIVYP